MAGSGSSKKPDERPPDRAGAATAMEEALRASAAGAGDFLGKLDGFWANPNVRIPLPIALQAAELVLRAVGKTDLGEQFQRALNRAAEKAVPQMLEVLFATISKIRPRDAWSILRGPEDAATQYLRRTAWEALVIAVRPIVAEATEEVGVTRTYKQIEREVRPFLRLVDPQSQDLDTFVTEHALRGLFLMMAIEEKKIRADPLGRASELLRRFLSSRLR